MLERYFVKPQTVDRIRSLWLGREIERYVVWLSEQGYANRTVLRRVPLLARFAEFAQRKGAAAVEDLPSHVEAFITEWLRRWRPVRGGDSAWQAAKEARGPIEQWLELVVPGFRGTGRAQLKDPFVERLPGFFEHLVSERGLRPATIRHYRHHLHRFAAYLVRIGVSGPEEISVTILSAFVAERAATGMARTTLRDTCGVLRVFLRYAHREGLLPRNLSMAVEWPQAYRLSTIPRSISWGEVGKVLDAVDRRTPLGKRDYAIMLLLVTYGLRSREIAELVLDDIDWRRERLAIPERKAGHSSAFPLSTSVGEALADYLRHARAQTTDRHVFLRAIAPFRPIGSAAISARATYYLRKAGVDVVRPGSHTLRHTCVQRLVDASFALKTIGDFVGHRSAASTQIYAKVAVDSLRQVALGDGEEVL
ncbi:MAG: site-specific integrase [Bacillota bacterium]|nr:site-specific integrase [Bacillota bacterium]